MMNEDVENPCGRVARMGACLLLAYATVRFGIAVFGICQSEIVFDAVTEGAATPVVFTVARALGGSVAAMSATVAVLVLACVLMVRGILRDGTFRWAVWSVALAFVMLSVSVAGEMFARQAIEHLLTYMGTFTFH